MSLREIALICEVQVGRRPSHHSVQKVLAAGPAPSVTTRRFPPYSQISDPSGAWQSYGFTQMAGGCRPSPAT